jgi:hypothetical protein
MRIGSIEVANATIATRFALVLLVVMAALID